MSATYLNPMGYTSQRPANWQPIDRRSLLRSAHAIARRMRADFGTYAEALAHGLRAAWQWAKLVQACSSLRAQVAPVQHTPHEIAASREATRRCGSSLWAS